MGGRFAPFFAFSNDSKFTPFIGANLGYYIEEVTGLKSIGYDADKLEISGLTYGIGVGAIYEISKNFDIELNVKYNKSSAEGNIKASGVDIKFELDYIAHFGIGVNYNF